LVREEYNMSMSDTIADMIARIKNGQKSKLLFVKAPFSKMKVSILNVLLEEGYVKAYSVNDTNRDINIELKYSNNGSPAILEISRVSTPGRRVYSSISSLSEYYNGMGTYIISTPKGIISDKQARKLNVGGEVICKVF